MKGTITTGFANVKTMDGTAMPSPLAMQVGDYAFGVKSVTGSDLINFDHFYRKIGTIVELGKLCKANAANMVFDLTAVEPGTPPPPPPPTVDELNITESFIYYDLNGIPMSQRMIPDGPATAR